MLRISSLLILVTLAFGNLQGQMWNGTDSIFGNEWIDYDQSYFKIHVANDGMYRLSKSTLESAGLPMSSINGGQLQLFYLGEEIPVYVSTDQSFESGDYLEFYGQKNRAQFDRYLYKDADNEMLNPEYSLVTDTSGYFLTWTTAGSTTQRFNNIDNDLNNLPTAESFYTEKTLANFFNRNIQDKNSDNVATSSFEAGEGFGSTFLNSHTVDLPTSDVFAAGGDAAIELRMSTDPGAHDITIGFAGNSVLNETPNGFGLRRYSFEVASSSLEDNNELTILGNTDAQDKISLANAWLIYPRAFDFNGENQFIFEIEAGNEKYLEIENFNAEGQAPVLYDVTNNSRITTSLENGTIRVKLPASSEDRTLVLSSQVTGYRTAAAMATNFVDLSQSDANFIILSNPKLFNNGSGVNHVNDYANYRASTLGGSHESKIVDVQQIYDQFGYGIDRHFLSIRNFGHYVYKEWENPEYIFIIGKGRTFADIRTDLQFTGSEPNFFVPTFGSPGADNLLMGRLNSNTPIIPIGRIAASTPSDIRNYLDKVELMENGVGAQIIEDQLWKKRVLHLGGGNNTVAEQTTIKNHLFTMEEVIENNKFGAEVTSFFKTSSDPIQLGDSDAIFNRINNGVSMLTFFGHSAVGTFDFNIDNPLKYENYGKYPSFTSLGCFSGNIHTAARGISERFVFLKDKGALTFAASTGQAYISTLSLFAQKYYDNIGDDYYGEGIGKIIQETIRNFESNQGFSMVTLSQQFTLHGDPAIKIHPKEGPDYIVDSESISFSPATLNANLDSFTVNFSIVNLGYTVNDSIDIILRQELPNGEKRLLLEDRVKTSSFSSSFTYKVGSFKKEAAGQNKLLISLDTANEIEERPDPDAEINNKLVNSSGTEGVAFFIFDDSAKPIYPKEFGIVNDQSLTLKASTIDGLAPERKYYFEIDTTELFNSPIKTRGETISTGGVVRWSPTISMNDNTVYYWRVSPDSVGQANLVWENSSFVYLPNEDSKGWNQSHYYQYLENGSQSITVNQEREFQFPDKTVVFRVDNKVYNSATPPKGYIGNNSWTDFFRWELNESITFVVFSKNGTNDFLGSLFSHLWFNENPGEYGSVNTTSTRIASFPFPTQTTNDRENIINFLENIVPDSAFVVAYTALRTPTSSLNTTEWVADSTANNGGINLFNLFESYGANQIRSMENVGSLPYVFAFKKSGDAIYEKLAVDNQDVVDYQLAVPSQDARGSFSSVNVGPASNWDKLFWDYDEIGIGDTVEVVVYGINTIGQVDSLMTIETIGEHNLGIMSAVQYPYLRFQINAMDEVDFTPVQLKHWRVLYEGLPEVAVSSGIAYSFNNDTLVQGAQGSFDVAIENIAEYDLDSLVLKYSIVDGNNNEKIFWEKTPPIPKYDHIVSNFSFDTRSFNGINNLVLEVNPEDSPRELYHFNNFAVKPFFIEQDERNPLLDVTFDGLHILDGDIISPKPNITISLNDENEYLALSDTSLFKLFLKHPGEQIAENIPIEDAAVTFYPALAGEGNKARIEYSPQFIQDGVYELLVQAEDVSGNQSGDLDYKVTFEVITKSSISNVLNYPNPFSTSTQFVYTLTGEEVPEFFKIQIFTASGRIVKEITQDEIGPLRVGTHRTDYRWNGTDDYGDRLANGVYLYRVVAKKSGGQTYDAFENGTESMFKKGFGKLVIIR